jgi:tetratricopeptide (TPR) repeat protein
VKVYPNYAEAWYELGRAHEETQRTGEAREAYQKAVELDDHYLPPAVRLAALDARAGDWESVAARTGRIIRMNPVDFPEAYFYNAVACFQLRQWPETERAAREAVARNAHRQYPQVLHILGMVLAQQGRLEEAVNELERFLEVAPTAKERPVVERQIAAIRQHGVGGQE